MANTKQTESNKSQIRLSQLRSIGIKGKNVFHHLVWRSNSILGPAVEKLLAVNLPSIKVCEMLVDGIGSLTKWGAVIAQRIRLLLPYCRPGFESQAYHLHFFHFILFVLYLSREKNENKTKRGRIWPIFNKIKDQIGAVSMQFSVTTR